MLYLKSWFWMVNPVNKKYSGSRSRYAILNKANLISTNLKKTVLTQTSLNRTTP